MLSLVCGGERTVRDAYNINKLKPGGLMWAMEHAVIQYTKLTPTQKVSLSHAQVARCDGLCLYEISGNLPF